MFEDSTFESMNRIRTRSRGWMVATFTFNASILLALVLVPLLDPQALPRQFLPMLMTVPEPPQAQTVRPKQPVQAPQTNTAQYDPFSAPTRIPTIIVIPDRPEGQITMLDQGNGIPGGVDGPAFAPPVVRVVRPAVQGPVRISGPVEAGLLLDKRVPVYPPIAKAAGVSGTVTLAATISKNGTIENLRVTGGPAMLQQAALDAVAQWHYRPYLLDGQPVEVETTVSVIFTLGR